MLKYFSYHGVYSVIAWLWAFEDLYVVPDTFGTKHSQFLGFDRFFDNTGSSHLNSLVQIYVFDTYRYSINWHQ